MNNLNLSSKKNTISAHLVANKDYLASATTKEEILSRLEEVLSGCNEEKVNEILKAAASKKDVYKIIQYVWDIILKGDGQGSFDSARRRRDH